MKLIKTTLTGIGQIFLQENGISGLLITVAMFFSHWTLGVSCFLGVLIGTLTAQALHYPENEIRQGLYGFNAGLAFMCVMFTFAETDASNPVIWLLGAGSSIVSTCIMRIFVRHDKVAYTFPFVLSSWLFCWATAHFGWFGLTQTTPALADYTNTLESLDSPFYAWAEVNFGASAVTGILLFIAIAISSPMAAMWGMASAALGAVFALHLFNVPLNHLANGLYGFSPILVACAFAGSQFRDFCYVVIGVLLAVAIQYAVAQTGLATYTIGFIIAGWILLPIKHKMSEYNFHSGRFFNRPNP